MLIADTFLGLPAQHTSMGDGADTKNYSSCHKGSKRELLWGPSE